MENFVTVTGTFPAEANIWFGQQPGTVYVQTNTWIVVATPAVTDPQTVELSVRTRNGEEQLVVPDAYAYQPTPTAPTPDPGSGGTDPTPTPSPSPTPGPGSGGSDPGSGGSDPGSGGSDPGSGGSDPETGDQPSPERQARPVADGEPVRVDSGLWVRPIDGLDDLLTTPACTTAICRPHRIGG